MELLPANSDRLKTLWDAVPAGDFPRMFRGTQKIKTQASEQF